MARRRHGGKGKPRRSWGTAVKRWAALLLGVGGVLCFLAIAVDQADRDRHFLDSDRTAEAMVLTREGKQARIAFTVDGRRVVTEMDAFSGTQSGDRITVRYHPDDPSRYVMDDRSYLWPYIGSLVALAGGGLLALITWQVWRSDPEIWEAWRS